MSSVSPPLDPIYRQLQKESPRHWHLDGYWLLTRYQDVKAILLDPRFGHPPYTPPTAPRPAPWWDAVRQRLRLASPSQPQPNPDLFPFLWFKSTALSNPPEHTRLRGQMMRGLTAQRLHDLRPRIEAIANDLIDQVEAHRTMEFVSKFAYPLATMTITELLGVPAAEYPSFMQHLTLGQGAFLQIELADLRQIRERQAHALALVEYCRSLIAARQREPQDDLISALTMADDEGKRLSDDEVLGNVILLAIAGYETTYQFLTTALWLLLQHPDALEHMRAQAGADKAAMQELLRLCGPTQLTDRVALQDVVWEGQTIRKGQTLRLVLAAANRDEEQFAGADVMDLTRRDPPHLAFGAGIHQCPGAPLARMQTTVALEILLQRLPALKLPTAAVVWRNDLFLAPRELWVTW